MRGQESTDELDQDTTERWRTYRRECRARGAEPMTWGAWLAAGQPLPG